MKRWRLLVLVACAGLGFLFFPLPCSFREQILFLGPGNRSVLARALGIRFDDQGVSLQIQGSSGNLQREITTPGDGGLMAWVAWSEDGKRLFILSCGCDTSAVIDTIEVEGSLGGAHDGTEATARLEFAMQLHFRGDRYLQLGKGVSWFCDGFGRERLRSKVRAGGGALRLRQF